MRMPDSLLLGPLTPMPPPVATGPPGMMYVTLDQEYVRKVESGEQVNVGEKRDIGRSPGYLY